MNGRTTLGVVAGALVAAGAGLSLLHPTADPASAAIEVEEPPAALVVLREAPTEGWTVPGLEPRAHPRPAADVGRRSALAAAMTPVPAPPAPVAEPAPPLLAEASGGASIEIPALEAVRLPVPEASEAPGQRPDACRGLPMTIGVTA